MNHESKTQPEDYFSGRQLRSASHDSWSFHFTGQAPPPDGLSLWLVRLCRIFFRTTCVILLLAEIHLDNI